MSHVCQIILVQAEDVDDAFSLVEGRLDETYPSWSDWHNASNAYTNDFAGRWSGVVFADEANPDKQAPNYLRYSDDPALAEKVISDWLEARMSTLSDYRTRMADLATTKYNPYVDDLNMPIYYSLKVAEILNDNWTSDSGVYDLTGGTANLRWFIDRVKSEPTKQYLIPVDFHF
jgi:hypothetical protein